MSEMNEIPGFDKYSIDDVVNRLDKIILLVEILLEKKND